MAKYNCVTRSSYFYVTDEFKYEKFRQHIVVRDSDERIEFWHKVGNNALRYLGAEVSIVIHNNYETLVLDEIIKNRLSNKKGITYSDIDMWF